MWQDYGLDGGLGQFCSDLISPEYTNDPSATSSQLQNGIVSFFGLNRSIEIYAQVIANTAVGVADNASVHRRGHSPDSGSDESAWLYQTCTEAGTCDINLSYASSSCALSTFY